MSSQASTPPSIAVQKSHLRSEVMRARHSLDATTRVAETAACHQALFALSAFQLAPSILCTLNFGDEMNTRTIIDNALSLGKRVALPRVNMKTMQLQLFWFDANTTLEKNRFGIDEPALNSAPAQIEDAGLILVPGLAFDNKGNRLGYGRGYYDKLLFASKAHNAAIAYACQVVANVPTESHDAQINTLITATQTQHFLSSKVHA